MESKTVIYTPDSGAAGSGAGMLGMLAPLLQKSGLDPNLLLAMNRNNSGFGGDSHDRGNRKHNECRLYLCQPCLCKCVVPRDNIH